MAKIKNHTNLPEQVNTEKKSIKISEMPSQIIKDNGDGTFNIKAFEGNVEEAGPQPTGFDKIIEDTLSNIRELIIVKGKEYRRNNDPYHNFERGAKITGQTPEKVLHGFMMKHFISYSDILDDIDKGILPSEKLIDEKIDDLLVYLLLQKTLILKRIEDAKMSKL